VPLHYQIQRVLRGKIQRGEWAPGDRIPTEMALVGRFQVSRATLREALSALERDGLITRHRRLGSFVRVSPPMTPSGLITNLVLGYKTAIRVIGKEMVAPPSHVMEFLGVGRRESVHRFVRVEFVGGAPLAVVINYMPYILGRRIRLVDLARISMLEILRDKLAIPLGPVHQQLEARMPDEEIAALLRIDLTQPTLLLRLLVSDKDRRPLEVADSFYAGDRYRYELRNQTVPTSVATRRPSRTGKAAIKSKSRVTGVGQKASSRGG
jgi:GntR family transcriptional regulator